MNSFITNYLTVLYSLYRRKFRSSEVIHKLQRSQVLSNIVAHSGGTMIGIKTAYKYPEKIHAYIGVAQIINIYEQENVSYDFILKKAKKAGDVGRQKAINAIGPPPYESHKDNYSGLAIRIVSLALLLNALSG